MAAQWKWYVYQFFSGDVCVYVGKGSGTRFLVQKRRFTDCKGAVVACFREEADALEHEKMLITELMPRFNKAHMPSTPSPWKMSLVPEDRDVRTWCKAIGTKNMAARILLAKPWSFLRSHNIDIESLLSKVEHYCGEYHGARC